MFTINVKIMRNVHRSDEVIKTGVNHDEKFITKKGNKSIQANLLKNGNKTKLRRQNIKKAFDRLND